MHIDTRFHVFQCNINNLQTHLYIYIYIYMCVCVCVCVCVRVCEFFSFFAVDPKREKSYNFKMNRSTQRFVFFKELFCSYTRVCFQLVAFVREHMWLKAIWIGHPMRLKLNLPEWIWVLLGAAFIWTCVIYVLWRKQRAGNILVCKNEIANS